MFVRLWLQKECSLIDDGNAKNGIVTLEDGLAVSYKAKHILMVRHSN